MLVSIRRTNTAYSTSGLHFQFNFSPYSGGRVALSVLCEGHIETTTDLPCPCWSRYGGRTLALLDQRVAFLIYIFTILRWSSSRALALCGVPRPPLTAIHLLVSIRRTNTAYSTNGLHFLFNFYHPRWSSSRALALCGVSRPPLRVDLDSGADKTFPDSLTNLSGEDCNLPLRGL